VFRTPSRARLTAAGLLAVSMIAVARSDTPPSESEQIEKQIAELKAKLDAIKAKAAQKTAAPPATPTGFLPQTVLDKITWRSIGPANMGGRVTALAVYEPDPSIYYVATASGGLLKTTNNGTTFAHQFDRQSTVSIGDVAVCQTNPDLVWVGSGEANPRNSVSYGDGVYKSTDGGKTWANMGLKKSFQIGRVLIHPKNPDTVYVGALGRLYGANEERGLYKTTDGGKTWNRVLYVDDKTGVIDAVMDPADPESLVVALWERKRDEHDGFFGTPPVPDAYGPVVTHGPGGGLFKSGDGGKSWKKLTGDGAKTGLPTVKTGRIGLDHSRKTKGLVYAIIDTEKGGTGDPPAQVYMGIQGETEEEKVKLTEITPNSPASKAGLKAGDVVTAVDGGKVDGYDALVERIRGRKPGDKLKLSVTRDGSEITVEVTLESRPGAGGQGQGGRGAGGGRGGRGGAAGGGAPGTPRPTAGFTPTRDADVLKIQTLTENGPAAKAGLKAGDVIAAVDGKPTKTLAEYQAVIGTKKEGDKVGFTVERAGEKAKVYEIVLGPPAASPTQPSVVPGQQAGRLMPGFAPELRTEPGELKVAAVAAGGPAEKAGIKVGDVILEVDGKKVDTAIEFLRALRTGPREEAPRQAGETVKVKVKSGEKEIAAELALAPMEVPGMGGGGPARGASADKPYGMGLGGQIPNAEAQGKDAFQTGGVFVSKDGGETWTRVNSLNPRPMYFSVIRVDPSDDNTLYVMADTPTPIYRSTNGGKRFENLGTARGVHADAHAFWIDPRNRRHLIIGCDGGFYASYDQGATWDHLNTLALGQFYHIAVDNRRPYRVYGGLQDNGSWGGPSNTARSYGPINEDWVYVSGGDGFVCRVDPTDPDLVYAESQGGAISRRNFRTGERGFVRPPQRTGEPPQRFNWNTPFILSAHNPSIFYTASQFVWRSIKKGTDLRKLSPEITRTKAGSGTALSESPLNPDVVWAGTDDGYVWVTRDGGNTWVNVTDAVKAAGLPGYRHVATLEASREKEGRCYACFDAHRSDDDRPYLFVTEDYGKTWKPLAGGLPQFGSTRVLREDVVNTDVLYCGTEFGAWVSGDRGATWGKLGANLPTVAVHEFAQPTVCGELAIATHGRSVWVTDVTSLRQIKPAVLKDKATLFAPGTAVRWRSPDGAESPYSRTDRRFVGENPYRGAVIDYMLTQPAKEVSLKVVDAAGKTVRTFDRAEKAAGFHRVPWNLSTAGVPGGFGGGGGRGGQGGRPVPPGTYRVILAVDGKEFAQPLAVELDPNAPKDLVSIDGDVPQPGEEEDEHEKEIEELKRLLRMDD
jgi:S1-C subfamily serine protease/photosystem II stability/assembly factor-like uncharacterized protein